MAYSSVFLQRALEFGIEVKQPVHALLVCKHMLENQHWKLTIDHRKLIRELDEIANELHEVGLVLEGMQHPQIISDFMKNKYVSSVDEILLFVQYSYSHIYAALTTREEGGNTTQVHFEVSQCLFACRKTLSVALQGFLI